MGTNSQLTSVCLYSRGNIICSGTVGVVEVKTHWFPSFLWLKQCADIDFEDILIVFIRRSVWLLWVCDRFMTLHLELSRLGWAPANKCGATGVKPLFIATQASWNSCSVQLHESAQMRSERIQKVFLSHTCMPPRN